MDMQVQMMLRQLIDIQTEQNDIVRGLARSDRQFLRDKFEENQRRLRQLYVEVAMAPSVG